MFKDILYNIKDEISSISNNKEITLKKAVDRKLDRSLKNYENNLELNAKYILSRSNYKVLKTIDRVAKKSKKDEEFD